MTRRTCCFWSSFWRQGPAVLPEEVEIIEHPDLLENLPMLSEDEPEMFAKDKNFEDDKIQSDHEI